MRNLILCLLLAFATSMWVMASDSSEKGKAAARTITGCLAQGDNAKEFNLTAEDGSTWEVKSSTVSLAEHVGHKVTLTGDVSHATAHNMKEDTKDMTHDAGVTKENKEHGHLKVTDVQMVSTSCTK